MRHPVRRSLGLAAAAFGLVAFGATAAHADSDWYPTEKGNPVVFQSAPAAGDTGRVVCNPDGTCCDADGCWTDRVDPIPAVASHLQPLG
ncbi:hypothetical protein [Streptomyces catenulae]|uniref:Secreted protein n=1 Tax=Streptomyces catenulae TaxID=66875 RepID=A0ABV2YU57_9ACTN|nr:hypothetical protein [Streptomyces catenulae]